MIAAPLFSASGWISVLCLQPEPWLSGNETVGTVTEGIIGFFEIWLTITMIEALPFCMAGTAIFFIIHWIVLRVFRVFLPLVDK